jgi:hypothetical protein
MRTSQRQTDTPFQLAWQSQWYGRGCVAPTRNNSEWADIAFDGYGNAFGLFQYYRHFCRNPCLFPISDRHYVGDGGGGGT